MEDQGAHRLTLHQRRNVPLDREASQVSTDRRSPLFRADVAVHGTGFTRESTRDKLQGLFELRLKSKEGIGRAFSCNLAGQRVMMLHAFVKKSSKTPAKELKTARDRMKEVQADVDA